MVQVNHVLKYLFLKLILKGFHGMSSESNAYTENISN